MKRSRRCLICTVVAGAALAPGATLAQTHRAAQTGVDLGAELRGLVAMPDGPPEAIVIGQRGGQRHAYAAGVQKPGSESARGRVDVAQRRLRLGIRRGHLDRS